MATECQLLTATATTTVLSSSGPGLESRLPAADESIISINFYNAPTLDLLRFTTAHDCPRRNDSVVVVSSTTTRPQP